MLDLKLASTFLGQHVAKYFFLNNPGFFIGDHRSNENPQLAVLHVIFVRLHNQVAEGLSNLNAHWDDQRLFEVRLMTYEY